MYTKYFFTLVLVALFAGCASNESYHSSRRNAVPVDELGSRGATFAGQAQQFHQNNMAMSVCPNGTITKKGGGSMNAGAGDQSGRVTYSVTSASQFKEECDYGEQNQAPKTPARNVGENPTKKEKRQ